LKRPSHPGPAQARSLRLVVCGRVVSVAQRQVDGSLCAYVQGQAVESRLARPQFHPKSSPRLERWPLRRLRPMRFRRAAARPLERCEGRVRRGLRSCVPDAGFVPPGVSCSPSGRCSPTGFARRWLGAHPHLRNGGVYFAPKARPQRSRRQLPVRSGDRLAASNRERWLPPRPLRCAVPQRSIPALATTSRSRFRSGSRRDGWVCLHLHSDHLEYCLRSLHLTGRRCLQKSQGRPPSRMLPQSHPRPCLCSGYQQVTPGPHRVGHYSAVSGR
jgi:hypothetical protein